MKTLILGLILTCFAGSTFALDKQELDNRIRTLTARLDALQQKPGKRIPADYLSKAQGVILMERVLVTARVGIRLHVLARDHTLNHRK